MSTDIQQDSAPSTAEMPASDAEMPASEPVNGSSTGSNEQWQQIWAKVSVWLADPIDYVVDFFQKYQRPIVTVLLVLSAFVAVKLTLAVLDALNDIPLFAPLLELVGLVYTVWFVYRYLWRAANRQELVENLNSFKDQVLGQKS